MHEYNLDGTHAHIHILIHNTFDLKNSKTKSYANFAKLTHSDVKNMYK